MSCPRHSLQHSHLHSSLESKIGLLLVFGTCVSLGNLSLKHLPLCWEALAFLVLSSCALFEAEVNQFGCFIVLVVRDNVFQVNKPIFCIFTYVTVEGVQHMQVELHSTNLCCVFYTGWNGSSCCFLRKQFQVLGLAHGFFCMHEQV